MARLVMCYLQPLVIIQSSKKRATAARNWRTPGLSLGTVASAKTAEQRALHERQSSLLYQTRCQGLILISDTDSRTCALIEAQQGEA